MFAPFFIVHLIGLGSLAVLSLFVTALVWLSADDRKVGNQSPTLDLRPIDGEETGGPPEALPLPG